MANYIVGDIQGCFDELKLLINTINFDSTKDTLWFAGDLVARGPKSLETLRFVKSLGASAKTVLGNHDLHLLATSIGARAVNPKDKTEGILSTTDRDELLHWLRHQPLLLEHEEFVLSHAGISPQWNLAMAREAAKEVETVLKSDDWQWLVTNMYATAPDAWSEKLKGIERYRYIINAFTRMRYCFFDGRLDTHNKQPPQELEDKNITPWFELPIRHKLDKIILFGHWAALQGYQDENVIGLDTGCVWGNELTVIRWEDKKYFYQPALK